MGFEEARYILLFLLALPIAVAGFLLLNRLLNEAVDIRRKRAAERKKEEERKRRDRMFEENYAKWGPGGGLRY